MQKFYITSAIPYVNAAPHIGHALEFTQADTVARYHRLQGIPTNYLCGSDENALKNVQAAEKAGKPVQEFIDENAKLFEQLATELTIQFDVFQKGSSESHHLASQELWKRCVASDDIYKKSYKGLYCLGCEAFYTPGELDEKGECFEHPGKKLDEIAEENYFFKLSKYQQQLIELIQSDTLEIVPTFRKNEIVSFLKNDLQDISISRSNERAKNWGVPVPGDETQRMYVWFDALNIYQSGVGFGSDEETYKKWWPADVHVIGKGIIRFHAVYWPAILLSAKLALPKKLFVHEYFTVNGQKMSKTLGNVVNPSDIIAKYGTDALRYYCLAKISPFADGDFSEEKLIEAYNADLANGLGNLVSRTVALVIKYCDGKVPHITQDPDTHPLRINENIHNWKKVWNDIDTYLPQYKFNEALFSIWKFIDESNKYIAETKPWELATTNPEEFEWVMYGLLDSIHQIAWQIAPFLPETTKKIGEILTMNELLADSPDIKKSWTNIPSGTVLGKMSALFPRI